MLAKIHLRKRRHRAPLNVQDDLVYPATVPCGTEEIVEPVTNEVGLTLCKCDVGLAAVMSLDAIGFA